MEETTALEKVPDTPRLSALTVRDVKEQINLIQEIMKEVMQKNEHYGVIPGCGDKPALLKAGAEKLCLTFRMAPEYDISETNLPNGHREIRIVASLKHVVSGRFLGEGIGSCSSMESKYRYRAANRKCPKCGSEAIIKGKEEYGGGWLCFAKKGGCGAKFMDNDAAVATQPTGRVENEDLSDQYNTILKMAKKRALVDAVLTVTAASDIFTQDIEDLAPPESEKGSAIPTRVVEAPAVSQVIHTREMISEKQRALFWARMKELNLGEDVVRGIVRFVRGQESTAGMSPKEMETILAKAMEFAKPQEADA